MSPACLVVLLAAAGAAPRVDVELALVYGNGSRTAFGGAAEATAGWQVWETAGGAGALEVGLLAGYQNEPYALVEALMGPSQVTGSNHRIELFAVVGHTLRLTASRRLLLGVQLFGGWTQLAMRGALTNADRGISGTYRADAAEFTTGLIFLAGVRLTERLSVVGRFILPVPYAGVAISSYFMASVGASMQL